MGEKVKQKKHYLTGILFLPFLCFAEGQELLTVFIDIVYFLKILVIGIGLSLILQLLMKKGKISKKERNLVLIIIYVFIIFFWLYTKHDSDPINGPIDQFFN